MTLKSPMEGHYMPQGFTKDSAQHWREN